MDGGARARVDAGRVRSVEALLRLLLASWLVFATLFAPTFAAEIAGRPLVDVIEEFRRQGLEILYSSSVVTPEMTVTREPGASEPVEALREILREHHLDLKRGPSGSWLVVPQATLSESSVSGRVVDAGNGVPVEKAVVTVSGVAGETRTEADGTFMVRGLSRGVYRLRVDSLGYLSATVENVRVPQDGPPIAVALSIRAPVVADVTVSPSRLSLVRQDQASKMGISDDDALLVPSVGGDVTRAVQLLPGVAAPDSSSAFAIRGSQPRDVSLILDGLELYEPFHLESLQSPFSYVDSNIVERIDVYGGGFTADFGDRHGGIVEMASSTALDPYRNSIDIGTVNSRFVHRGAYENGNGAWAVAARAWYPEELRDTIALGDDGIEPTFQDLYAQTYWLGSGNFLYSGHVLLARDRLDFLEVEDEETESADVSNRSSYAWLRALGNPGARWSTDSTLWAGRIDRRREGRSATEITESEVFDDRSVDLVGLRNDSSWAFRDGQLLKLGGDFRWLGAEYDYSLVDLDGTIAAVEVDRSPRGFTYGVYAAYRARLGAKLAAEVGLRWDRQEHVDDAQLSPRLHLSWQPAPRTELRFGIGRYSQSQRIHELQVEDGEREFSEAELSEQAAVTLQHAFRGGMLLRVDAYTRWLSDLQPRYENVFNPVELYPEAEPDRIRIEPQNARLQGVELLLRSDSARRFTWWVSYALSSADDLVDGGKVPRRWDQTHAANLLLGYRVDDAWTAALRVAYHSGWPTTPVDPLIVMEGGETEVEPVFGPRNSERFSSYFRVDLKLSRAFALQRGRLRLELEIVNVLDRDNVCCVDAVEFELLPDGSIERETELDTWLGITPTASVGWDF